MHQDANVLIFNDHDARPVEVDFRGTTEDVIARLTPAPEEVPADPAAAQKGPGRPRLGVVPREVTLLPRHWEWLAQQPGGASVALRKLVEEARRSHEGRDRIRRAQESAFRFMGATAGNCPGFEEATRALFAGNRDGFRDNLQAWPPDLRAHAEKLATEAFCAETATTP